MNFVFKKFFDEFEEFGVRRDTLLWGEEKITTKIVISVTDCGISQLTRVFKARAEGDVSSRIKVFKDLLKSIKNEVFKEAKNSEYPRLVVKFINCNGCLIDKREYWIEESK